MKMILFVVLLVGMVVECQSDCYSMTSDYWKSGCDYDKHFMKLDDYILDNGHCMRCHCREGLLLECCSEEIIIKKAPIGCKIIQDGCNDIAVHKWNDRVRCTQGITAVLL